MSEITVSERAPAWPTWWRCAGAPGPVYPTRRGQRVAAVIDVDDLDRLIAAAEDLSDIKAARTARDEITGAEAAVPTALAVCRFLLRQDGASEAVARSCARNAWRPEKDDDHGNRCFNRSSNRPYPFSC
jgi:hypothetical protein